MQEQTENKPQAKKLFGIGNPILKALLIIIFVLLTGGLGFIIVALAFVGDHLLSKSKKIPPQSLSVVLAALILVGCATEKVEKGLHLLQGEKLSTAISYLGYPDSKLEIEGKTIYQWGSSSACLNRPPVSLLVTDYFPDNYRLSKHPNLLFIGSF